MRIGADKDGREIIYGETEGWLKIGGIPTTIDRIIAYDSKDQIDWESEEAKAWAYEYYKGWQEHQSAEAERGAQVAQAASQQRAAAARRAQARVTGYDPASPARLAGVLKGLAAVAIIWMTVTGVVIGLSIGWVVAGLFAAGSGSGGAGAGVGLITGVVCSAVGGGVGFLAGYLGTLMLKALAEVLLTTVQIEVNTRPAE